MQDYLYIGSNPVEEPCVQTAHSDEYDTGTLSRFETSVFMRQLERTLGESPDGTYFKVKREQHFKVKREQHESGTYHEVVVVYDPDDDESSDYAFKAEGNMPAYWDEAAKAELAANATYMEYLVAKHGGFATVRA